MGLAFVSCEVNMIPPHSTVEPERDGSSLQEQTYISAARLGLRGWPSQDQRQQGTTVMWSDSEGLPV